MAQDWYGSFDPDGSKPDPAKDPFPKKKHDLPHLGDVVISAPFERTQTILRDREKNDYSKWRD